MLLVQRARYTILSTPANQPRTAVIPMATKAKDQVVRLDEKANPEGRVLITTQDEDRFSLPCAQAVEACRVHISRKVWFDELDSMLVRVKEWAGSHANLVQAVYAAPREGHVVIFVVPKSEHYDLDLGAKLSDLDLELAQQFHVIASEVMQVPGKTQQQLATFVNPSTAKPLYGEG